MKTILINPPSSTHRKPEEHLWLAYLKSFLERNWLNCEIIDWYLEWINNNEIIEKIDFNVCNIVWLSPSIDSLNNTREIAEKIKSIKNDIYIVLWGHLATFSYNDLLKEDIFDIVVRWEWEITFSEVVKNINNKNKNTNLSNIKGIAYKDTEKRIIKNSSRDLIDNLDTLPFPDRQNTLLAKQIWAICQISWSRWCYGNCSFCSINSIYRLSNWKTRRWRSAQNIVDELKHLNKLYGISIFKFVDDCFIGSWPDGKKRAAEIANLIIKSDIKIRFRISVRPNDVEENLFQLLQKAGLYSVSVWIESWHQRALKTFNKWTTIDENKKALNILKNLGIITLMWFIGFDPYTTIKECEQNIEFLKEMDFALSDIISKPLFIHANDPITTQLLKENRITERNFPNYRYNIDDSDARKVHNLLVNRNEFNKNIYYEITDMLTAPRITTKEQEKLLLDLYYKLRKIDLNIFDDVLIAVKQWDTNSSLSLLLNHEIEKYDWEIKNIQHKFYQLINNNERISN